MAGRPRKHPEDARRLSFKTTRQREALLEWYIDYLNAHAPVDERGNRPAFDKQSVLSSMFEEFIRNHATLFEAARVWVLKGKKLSRTDA